MESVSIYREKKAFRSLFFINKVKVRVMVQINQQNATIGKIEINCKKFLLFAGNDYYPKGGARDLIGSFDTLEDAQAAHDPNVFEYDGGWANIYSTESESIVLYFYGGVGWTENDTNEEWKD